MLIHFAEQGDPLFLLGKAWNPNQVSKVIGKISGVDAMILANRDLVNKRGAALRESRSLRARAQEGSEKLEAYAGLDEHVAILEEAEALLAEIREDERKMSDAMGLLRLMRDRRIRMAQEERYATEVQKAIRFADESNLLDDMVTMATVTDTMRGIERRENAERGELALAEKARTEAAKYQKMLSEIADSDELVCRLCGGPAHAECREAIRRSAEEL